jgi:hypothetical protein
MKNKIILMAVLIFAYSIALHAREVFIDSVDARNPQTETVDLTNAAEHDQWIELQQIGSKNLTAAIAIPDVYRMCCKTNSVTHHPPSGRTFPNDNTDAAAQNWMDGTSITGIGNGREMKLDYQLIHLSKNRKPSGETNGNSEFSLTQTTKAETSLFDNFTGNDLDWMLKPADANQAAKVAVGNKNPAQIIFIEPLKSSESTSAAGTRVYENGFSTIQPQPAWYEWIKPELFLVKWAEYWFTESTAEWEEHYWFSESNAPDLNTVDLLCFSF